MSLLKYRKLTKIKYLQVLLFLVRFILNENSVRYFFKIWDYCTSVGDASDPPIRIAGSNPATS